MNRRATLLAFFIGIGSFAAAAHAQSNFPVSANGAAAGLTVSQNDRILSSFSANESYCCTAYPDGSNIEVGFATAVSDPNSNSITGVNRGGVSPQVAVDSSADSSAADNRLCLFTSVPGSHALTVATGTAATVTVSCNRTTLSGGFNTNSTAFNFLECQNRSNTERAVRIFAFDAFGNLLVNGNTAANQHIIPPALRRDFDLHSAVGPNVFGEIRVLHDGPEGALDCRVSRYESDLEFKGTIPLN